MWETALTCRRSRKEKTKENWIAATSSGSILPVAEVILASVAVILLVIVVAVVAILASEVVIVVAVVARS